MRPADSEDPRREFETSLHATWPKLFSPEPRVRPEENKAEQEEQARRLRHWRMLWLRRLSGAYYITFAMTWVRTFHAPEQPWIAVSVGMILIASVLEALRYRLKAFDAEN